MCRDTLKIPVIRRFSFCCFILVYFVRCLRYNGLKSIRLSKILDFFWIFFKKNVLCPLTRWFLLCKMKIWIFCEVCTCWLQKAEAAISSIRQKGGSIPDICQKSNSVFRVRYCRTRMRFSGNSGNPAE